MPNIITNANYLEELKKYSEVKFIDWNKLKHKTILITGATGLVGRFFVDLIMSKNRNGLDCKIIAIGRNTTKAKKLLNYFDDNLFEFVAHDISKNFTYDNNIDYIVHCASNTSPVQYVTDPIGTIDTNVLGTKNLLELSAAKKVKKFILVSSFEVYGVVNNIKKIGEHDYGAINNTILRSCYPESKRLSESLCIAYSEQRKIDTSIVRLSRVFGPTMNVESTLSLTQFIKNGLNGEDIVLKSDGSQLYSYNYVGDTVTAILKVMLEGKTSEAYNVSSEKFDGRLRDFAESIAKYFDKKIIFDLPTDVERKGFSNSTMTILNGEKLKNIGWFPLDDLNKKINVTLDILQSTSPQPPSSTPKRTL